MKEEPRRSQPIEFHPPRFTTGAGTERGLRLLDKQLAILRAATEGTRNHTLNRCAFIVACAVARGDLASSSSRYQLEQTALAIGLSAWETLRTVISAFDGVAHAHTAQPWPDEREMPQEKPLNHWWSRGAE
jgi:hypothetical protein